VKRLQHNFGDRVVGADIALASSLPPAAGVSSSSALVVGLTLALAALSDLSSTPLWAEALVPRTALAGYCGAMENGLDFGVLSGERGVGTLGGAQDQTAILCCAPGKLDVFGWAPVRQEREVRWPEDHVFVIAVSGVVASKTGAARERYNRVARTAHRLVHVWNAQGGHARVLREVLTEAAGGEPTDDLPATMEQLARVGANEEFTASQLLDRLTQFHAETWRHVPNAAEALARGDLSAFGDLVAASQRGAELALGNQIDETIQLVNMARDLGAVAASAFGAGFGGSVWAMVPALEADRFASRWRERYVKEFPLVAHRVQVFSTRPAPPAFESI
jgi:galactokinase